MNAVLAEPLSFRGALDHAGRSDFVGAYHQTAQSRSDVKARERERVLAFILGHELEHIRLLSLPGLDWSFEHMLLASVPRSQIVGLEHSYTVFARSRRCIPRGQRTAATEWNVNAWDLQDREMSFGTGSYTYSRVAGQRHVFKGTNPSTRSNRLLLMSAHVFATMLTTDYGATYREKHAFRDRFYVRNAVWLDFTSQLGCSIDTAIANLHICLQPNDAAKPVVITVRNGRDAFHGEKARIAHIQRLQPAFELSDSWTYVGINGSSMLTVCGVMR